MGSGAELQNRVAVRDGRVALVLVPRILRKIVVQFEHDFIAVGFGQHRGRSDRAINTVSLDNAGVSNFWIRLKTISVDE